MIFSLKRLILLECFTLLLAVCNAQEIVFERTAYDFGTINEDGGMVATTYCFTNHSTKAVVVSSVRTTCGCTVVDYSKQPVKPGGTGRIIVSYNPVGRRGAFRRIVSVYFSRVEHPVSLKIQGVVQAGKQRRYSGYAYVLGNLQLRNTQVCFRPMHKEVEQQKQSLLVVNQGKDSLRVSYQSDDKSVSVELSPEILPPDGKGELVIKRNRILSETAKQTKTLCIRLSEMASTDKLLKLMLYSEYRQ